MALSLFPDFATRLSRLGRVRSSFGADAADRLALAWVYSLARFGTPEDAWHPYWTELTRPTWTYFGIANLQNFETDADMVAFDEGLTVRSRDLDALEELLGWDRERSQATLIDDWFRGFSPSRHVLVASEEVQKGPDNLVLGSTGTEWPRIQRLLLAMRLAGHGDVRIGRLYFDRREGIPLTGGSAARLAIRRWDPASNTI